MNRFIGKTVSALYALIQRRSYGIVPGAATGPTTGIRLYVAFLNDNREKCFKGVGFIKFLIERKRMKTILVTKYGSVFRTRADMKGASAAGEQGETEGIIRHLASRGDCKIIYFGQYRGEQLCDAVVNSDLSAVREVGTDPLCVTKDMQRVGWNADYRAICEHVDPGDIVGMVCVNGYSPTFSHVHNPRGATVQCAAINYAAPVLALLERLRVPRLCVNNDPRTYPRDQEMSYGWEWARPRALLDQCHGDVYQVVGGKCYRRYSVRARVESWAWLPSSSVPWTHRDHERAHVVAHAHFDTGIRNGSRSAWQQVLNDAPPCDMWGEGWDGFCADNVVAFRGKAKPSDVPTIMDKSLCAPVVSHTPGFYTGKPYLMVSRGCVPLLYGDGSNSHTYDPQGLLRPLEHSSRICRVGDFRRWFEAFAEDRTLYDLSLAQWRDTCKPDHSRLDELVDALLDGSFREDPERWGGYVPC